MTIWDLSGRPARRRRREQRCRGGGARVEFEYPSSMALNIKDPVTERLATELARLTGESKTRTVRVALEERRARLALHVPPGGHPERLRLVLEHEIWPQIPSRNRGPVTREERETILGYGPEGY